MSLCLINVLVNLNCRWSKEKEISKMCPVYYDAKVKILTFIQIGCVASIIFRSNNFYIMLKILLNSSSNEKSPLRTNSLSILDGW